MEINEYENFAKATFIDVVKYKVKWFLNTIYRLYRLYCRYIELYDFEDLF